MSKGTVTVPIEEFDRLREIERENKISNREEEIAVLKKDLEDSVLYASVLRAEIKRLNDEVARYYSSVQRKDKTIEELKDRLKSRFPWDLLFTLIIAAALLITYHFIFW